MINGGKIRLRDKRLDDARADFEWSRDPLLSKLDAAKPLDMSYFYFLSEYAGELRYPSTNRRRFAIETLDGTFIGNCSYYNISREKGEAEIGILIGDRAYWDNGYGTDAVNTLVRYVFEKTSLTRVYLKTLEWNVRAQRCFEKCRFTAYSKMVKDGYKFVLMGLDRSRWEEEMRAKGEQGLQHSQKVE